MSLSARKKFPHVQPEEKLGTRHSSLEAFCKAAYNIFSPSHKEKKYTLVLVTEPARKRILLGTKHRGFGQGFFNSFGGKMEAGETEAECARRELHEETGILVPLPKVSDAKVGTLRFTFDDGPTKMTVHLFRINVDTSSGNDAKENTANSEGYFRLDPSIVRGCDEITPVWFDDWYQIPLRTMFADDSVWLTHLLDTKEQLLLDGYFHFDAGGQETNKILHYHLDMGFRNANGAIAATADTFSLEKRLFHELHQQHVRSIDIKEFKESYAFVNAVRKFFDKDSFDFVIDVAGGHGALGALFLAVHVAREAVVVDPANVGGGGIQRAWKKFLQGTELRYRYEGLKTGLPTELCLAMGKGTRPERILVVACHACQHLSEEIVEIACRYGTNVAVMPCCQRDLAPGSPWKVVSTRLKIPMEMTMDLLLAGKAMSWSVGEELGTGYDVRMKVLEGSSTPQNRLILCRVDAGVQAKRKHAMASAQAQLDKAYRRAHLRGSRSGIGHQANTRRDMTNILQLLGSFCLGVAVTALVLRRQSV